MDTCVICVAPITSGRKAKYCGVNCRAIGNRRERNAQGRPYARPRYERVCAQCGKEWMAQNKTGNYCSHECINAMRYPIKQRDPNKLPCRKSRHRRRFMAERAIARAATGTQGRGTWTSGQCIVCSTRFIHPRRAITCSDDCRRTHRREMAHVRGNTHLARKRCSFIEKVYRKRVFTADGYRCHLCGRKTDPSKTVPHPQAPTVDHIVPLAAGGTHEPLNCRTAHFLCNSRKRALGGGEQLLLLA